MTIRGVWGRPFICLDRYLDLTPLSAIHDEVCLALAQIPVGHTGGSHRSMGIVPLSRQAECLVDYGEIVRTMSDADFATLSSLGDGAPLDPRAHSSRRRSNGSSACRSQRSVGRRCSGSTPTITAPFITTGTRPTGGPPSTS